MSKIDRVQRQRIRRARANGHTVEAIAQAEHVSPVTVVKYSNTAACRRRLLDYRLQQSVNDLDLAHGLKTLVRGSVQTLLQQKDLVLDPIGISKLARTAQQLESAAYTTLAKDLARAAEQDDPELAKAAKAIDTTKTMHGQFRVPMHPIPNSGGSP